MRLCRLGRGRQQHVDNNWGSFYLKVKRVSGSACSVLLSADLQHGSGQWVNSSTMGELCLIGGSVHTGLIVTGGVWAAQLRHSPWAAAWVWVLRMKWQRTLELFVFGSIAVFCTNFPAKYVHFLSESTIAQVLNRQQVDLLMLNMMGWPAFCPQTFL